MIFSTLIKNKRTREFIYRMNHGKTTKDKERTIDDIELVYEIVLLLNYGKPIIMDKFNIKGTTKYLFSFDRTK